VVWVVWVVGVVGVVVSGQWLGGWG